MSQSQPINPPSPHPNAFGVSAVHLVSMVDHATDQPRTMLFPLHTLIRSTAATSNAFGVSLRTYAL